MGIWNLPGFLEQQGLIGPKPVQAVATHIHFDHSGGLHQFEKFSIHSLEAEAIRQGDNFVTSTLFFSASEIAVPPYQGWKISDYRVKAAEPYTVVEEGHVFDLGDRSLRVVHLPGHTPGSIGLIDERVRILFTGDVMYCKERFSMNSLFRSNIIYSFQIFALTLFLVIHTEFA